MSKRARRPSGFYASLLSDDTLDPNFKSKYRPKAKINVLGTYEVERVVAKRLHRGKAEYFVKWKDYDAAENTWKPEAHLPEHLVTSLESRSVDPLRAEECKERLALLFERALKSPMACNKTLTIRHDVVRSLFPGMPSDLRGSPYLASENDLIDAGLASSLKKHLTVTGGGCRVTMPVHIKLFLGKSPAFRDEHGHKTARRPVEKVQVKFTKTYFTGSMQQV